jgi:CubicO group peptidase (beta-lactamase class C family)
MTTLDTHHQATPPDRGASTTSVRRAAVLSPTVEAAEAGFDPVRLERIDAVLRDHVDSGRIPCSQFVLTRGDEVVHYHRYGFADREAGAPLRDDSIFRIYSMTKPITSVGLMMLYEQGRFLLEDPIEKYLPQLAEPTVWVSGEGADMVTRPASRSINIRDLLTHTAGLTYGFQMAHPVDALYRERGYGVFGEAPEFTPSEMLEGLGELPLQFDPGAGWWYSMATDVCAALIEVLTGQTLEQYFRKQILDPLQMHDTTFWVEDEREYRFTTCYGLMPNGTTLPIDTREESVHRVPPYFQAGGGGLLSTLADYQRFTRMLSRGGELDGVRLLSPRTVDYMRANHLPAGQTMAHLGQTGFSEGTLDGSGFGLGFSVNIDPVANKALGSVGDYGWGGAASTWFRVDPVEDLSMIFLTQLMPSNAYPIRRELRATVYQALVD